MADQHTEVVAHFDAAMKILTDLMAIYVDTISTERDLKADLQLIDRLYNGIQNDRFSIEMDIETSSGEQLAFRFELSKKSEQDGR